MPPHTAPQAPPVWRAPEGPEGTGGLRDRPLRAFRLACGDLAGGRARRRPEHPWGLKQHNAGRPPPTGTPSSPATRPGPTAPGTPAAPQQRTTPTTPRHTKTRHPDRMSACGGARGIRTPDLLIANETRYQLRHSPKDSNSLAPSQSAVQADHCRVRHDTERQRKRATRRQRNLDECVTGALHIGRHNSDSLNTRAAQPAQQHPHATAPRARRPAARHQQLRGPLLGASRVQDGIQVQGDGLIGDDLGGGAGAHLGSLCDRARRDGGGDARDAA